MFGAFYAFALLNTIYVPVVLREECLRRLGDVYKKKRGGRAAERVVGRCDDAV